MARDYPKPEAILEQLAERVAQTIDAKTEVAFDIALGEMVSYHAFLIGLNATASQGPDFSFAQVGEGWWHPPHQEWIRQYRRLFERAIDEMNADDYFVSRLVRVANRLLMDTDRSTDMAGPIVSGILDLGPIFIGRLEAWLGSRVDRRESDIERSGILTGGAVRVYSGILGEFVGAWEQLLQIGILARYRNVRAGASRNDAWESYRAGWTQLQRHLQNTAVSLAMAVWNADKLGSETLLEAFIRWPVTNEPGAIARFRSPEFLLPDLVSMTWEEVLRRLDEIDMFSGSRRPEDVFGAILRGSHRDMVFCTAQVFLRWAVTKKEPTNLAGEIARKLMSGKINSTSDEITFDDAEPDANRRLSAVVRDLVLRSAPRGPYRQSLSELVARLDGLAERQVIPGRTYTPSTINGLSDLLPMRAAMFATAVSADAHPRLVSLANALERLQGDSAVRSVVAELARYRSAIEGPGSEVGRAVVAIGGAGNAASLLSAGRIIEEAISEIETGREKTLRSREIDHDRLDFLARSLFDKIGPPSVFGTARRDIVFLSKRFQRLLRIGGVKKASLVSPPMEELPTNWDTWLEQQFLGLVHRQFWSELGSRKKRAVKLIGTSSSGSFWRAIGSRRNTIQGRAILLMGSDAHLISRAARDHFLPDALTIEFKQPRIGENADRYVITVNDIDIFDVRTKSGQAWLMSDNAIEAYAIDESKYRLDYTSTEELTGELQFSFRLQVRWSTDPIYELWFKANDDP